MNRFNVDTLKIDHVFINGLLEGSENAALIKSIIAMTQRMGVAVVAEGVERQNQCKLLTALKCNYLQSHYFNRAMAHKPAFEALME